MYVAVCQLREKVYAANDWIGLCNPSALLRFAYVNLRGRNIDNYPDYSSSQNGKQMRFSKVRVFVVENASVDWLPH